jgi:hypothetical protein
MSENLKILYYAMWIAHPVLELGIGIFMLRHGLLKQFKFFFGYILAQFATFVILFSAYAHSPVAAFYLFWVCNAFSVTFGFLVIHEVFVDVFRLFHTLRDLGSVLFKWAGLVMLLVAGVVSVSTNSSEAPPWMQAIITSQRCVRFIQVGMVLFLLFFAHYVGVSRRQLSFGIALGFGSFAVVELILISSFVGNHLSGPLLDMANMLAYNASLGLWLGYVALKRPARDGTQSLLRPQRWEQSLADIHNPLPPDSLIPMFEGMVDRALSRAHQDSVLTPETRPEATAVRGAAASSSVGRSTVSVRPKDNR